MPHRVLAAAAGLELVLGLALEEAGAGAEFILPPEDGMAPDIIIILMGIQELRTP